MISTPQASVILPTRNRKDILRDSIRAALNQSVPVEVIVVDDGSTDGTSEMMAQEFPQVKYRRFEGPRGPTYTRNRGSEMASAPIIFPIDDDAVLVSPRTVAQTLQDFDDLRVGAVAIPYINVRRNQTVHQQAPTGANDIFVTEAYLGASHALRRDLFLQLGGYREDLFYSREEEDYCIRMLEAGSYVRLGNAAPIHHHESKNRATWRMDYSGRRNDVLYAWYNVPMPYLPVHLAATILNGIREAGRGAAHPFQMLRGTLAGIIGILRYWKDRKPVSPRVYQLSRKLRKAGSLPLDQITS